MNITKFGLNNFRIFKDHYDFELAPIMVLTGPNNSGKSSLCKALLLLKSNQDAINKILHWETNLNYFNGDHDLGNHTLTCNKKEENTFFSFTFFKDYKFEIEIDTEGKFIWDYTIKTGSRELVIAQVGSHIKIDVSNFIQYLTDRIDAFRKQEHQNSLVPIIDLSKVEELIYRLKEFKERYWKIDIDIITDFDSQANPNLAIYKNENTRNEAEEGSIKGILTTIPYDNSDELYIEDIDCHEVIIFILNRITTIKLTADETSYLIPTSLNNDGSNSVFFHFSDLIYVNTLKEPLKRAYNKNDGSIFQSFINFEIERENQELFQYQGNQFRINVTEEIEDKLLVNGNSNRYKKFVQKWLRKFEIGKELHYGYNEEHDIYFIKIDNKSLPDYGLGISAIIHVLLALSNEVKGSSFHRSSELQRNQKDLKLHFPATYIIEEPETGLHPAFQTKMAEMIVDIQKTFDVNLIIETHSEYFIRKLQHVTAVNEVNPGEAIIYYFNNPDKIPENEEQIKKITINGNGSLSDNFGSGFIDEGIALKFELLRLNKNSQN